MTCCLESAYRNLTKWMLQPSVFCGIWIILPQASFTFCISREPSAKCQWSLFAAVDLSRQPHIDWQWQNSEKMFGKRRDRRGSDSYRLLHAAGLIHVHFAVPRKSVGAASVVYLDRAIKLSQWFYRNCSAFIIYRDCAELGRIERVAATRCSMHIALMQHWKNLFVVWER